MAVYLSMYVYSFRTNVSGLILFAHGEDLFQHCPFFENNWWILLHTAIFLSCDSSIAKKGKNSLMINNGCILNYYYTNKKKST